MRRVWSKRSHLVTENTPQTWPLHGSGNECVGVRNRATRLSGHQRLALVLLSCCPPFDLIQSPMQEVSRKRPHLGDSEPLPSKKRAVSVNGPTVPVNGTVLPTAAEDEEPRDQDSLEVDFIPFFFGLPVLTRFVAPFQQFRKEAIFRRMRHYSRENERSQARISELEHLKITYEASLAVMGACWTQVC
jgi:hypothetical protein